MSHPLFPATPRPDQAVAHPAWQAALSGIEAGLGKPGLIAVIGQPGAGKTLLLHAVAERVLASGGVAALFQPTPVPGSRRPDVILIDDAGRLTASMLRALAKQGRPVVVAGGPALAERLQGAGVPAVIVTLGPLAPDDAAAFIKAQVAAAERPADLIQPAALMQLVERSRGVARDLQMLAGLSVFVARLADASQVTPAHVDQAALIQTGTEPGDDDADLEDEGTVHPPHVQRVPAQPLAAQSLPMERLTAPLAAPAGAQRGITGWTMAALALGALGAGAGIGWLLIPIAGPWLLALAGHAPRPAAERPVPSLAAADPRPARPAAAALPSAPDPGAPRRPLATAAAQSVPPAPVAPEAPAVPSRQALAAPAPPQPALPGPRPLASPAVAGLPSGAVPGSEPVRPAAIQALPLPPASPLHVVVLYDPGSADAGARAASLVEELGKRGYQVPPPEPGAVRGEPAVSYAFAEDAPAAAALAHAIGLEATQVRPAAELRPGAIRVAVNPAVPGRTPINLQPMGSRR